MKKIFHRQTLYRQMMGGYIRVILFTCILGLIIFVLQGALYWNYQMVNKEEENRLQIQQSIVAHYGWIMQLNDSLQNGTEFEGSLDPTSCSFGRWVKQNLDSVQDDPTATSLVEQIDIPHTEMHTAAAEVLQVRQTDPKRAME